MEICPVPLVWNAIYRRLLEASRAGGGAIPPPPVALILAGWAYTNDVEKQERWQATLIWAQRYWFRHLVGALTRQDMYCVDKLDGDVPRQEEEP